MGSEGARRADGALRLAFFGAAPDTANLGVSALLISAIAGLARRLGAVEFVVFDNGFGERRENLLLPTGEAVPLIRFGARMGRRYYRAEHLETMALAARLGRAGAWANRAVALIDSCDAVIDASGGDSFSDIYGRQRFRSVYLTKFIAVTRGKPLFLLPQTYGPYAAPEVRVMAAQVTRCAEMAWARDGESFRKLRDLLGSAYDAERHCVGVDMAFGLEPAEVELALGDWFTASNRRVPLVGFNVSGLLFHKADGGMRDFGLKMDYRRTVVESVRALLDGTNARVLLIPHVVEDFGHYESDPEACAAVARELREYGDRLAQCPALLSAAQAKWVISRTDWFCGTRMHSTIAGLSSGVPTAAISYSDKTAGVFASCGLGETVFDPRLLDGAEIAARLVECFNHREEAARVLAAELPTVRRKLDEQFDRISARIVRLAGRREAA